MKHIPHVVVPAPWTERRMELSVVQWRHMTRVMRLKSGAQLTYTDGLGTIGSGSLSHQSIERGDEETVPRPTSLTVAVAPPSNKDRQRFLVEKLTELGVEKLVWLKTKHGANRPASSPKVFSWIVNAVEQSQGAWLMEVALDMLEMSELEGRVVVCDREGDRRVPDNVDVVAIGPEGGFAEGEIPSHLPLWGLGPTVLRVETAAVVATARLGIR